MTGVEIVAEVYRLREVEKQKQELDRLVERLRDRVAALEARDRERAAHLTREKAKTLAWERQAKTERALREEADRNSARWHALLLQAKVRQLPERTT